MTSVKHLAIIMDGNRRWAKAKGLLPVAGHRQGYETAKAMGDWCLARGIKYLTLFAFSTENWKRSKTEVGFLMKLLKFALTKDLKIFLSKGINLRIIGDKAGFSQEMQKVFKNAEEKTKVGQKGVLNLAINYGGRLELARAAQKICQEKIAPGKITEETISHHLWTAGQPDPDLIIRTSGEQRLSGFLTWQSVYSELYFCQKHWPAFTEKDLDEALADFDRRQRRFGGN